MIRARGRRRGFIGPLALVLVLAACGQPSANSSPSPSPPVKLTVSYSNAVADNLPLWIAKEAGIFLKNGLDVDPELITSTTGIAALVSGQTQIAQIGGSEALNAVAGGADLVLLATLTPVHPYVFYGAPGITTINDIKGKKVGVPGLGGSSDIAVRVSLQKSNIDPDKDVTIVQLGSVPNVTAGMLNGSIQGAVSHPPESLELEAKGFHPLVNLVRLKLPAASDTIVTQRSFLTANPQVVQKYVDSIIQAIAREKKDKSYSIDIMKKYIKLTDERALSATYDFYVKDTLPSLPYPKPEQLYDAQAVSKNPKVRSYDVSKMLDGTFVKKAAESGQDRS